METTNTIGLSRQIVLERALNITANNIANQNTAGFKAEQSSFREYLLEAQPGTGSLANTQNVSLVVDPDSITDFSQGALVQTHAALDFAISGAGFFAVETNNGIRYTRDGHFGISSFGELVTRNGDVVLDDNNTPILFDPQGDTPVLSPEGELQQNSAFIARLGVFTFEDPQSLRREGNNLFVSAIEGVSKPSANIQQGVVESANVQAIAGITQMIDISRAYSQAAELIETTNELSRNTIRTFTQTN